jgi:large subunit ribosomal protein L31
MKKNLHPTINEVKAHCACGNEFVTQSTKKEVRVTLCSSCHPFFTGAHKFVDSAGRIEKFQKKYQDMGKQKTAPVEAVKPTAKTVTKKSSSKNK